MRSRKRIVDGGRGNGDASLYISKGYRDCHLFYVLRRSMAGFMAWMAQRTSPASPQDDVLIRDRVIDANLDKHCWRNTTPTIHLPLSSPTIPLASTSLNRSTQSGQAIGGKRNGERETSSPLDSVVVPRLECPCVSSVTGTCNNGVYVLGLPSL